MTQHILLTGGAGYIGSHTFIALHEAGTTISDGIADVSEIWHENGGEASGLTGYCFYHEQDRDRAAEFGGLSLAFGSMTDRTESTQAVGASIVAALTRHGLSIA